MKNIPERIYLQIDDDELPEDFNQLEVTWCSDRINENDIAYVREPSSPTVKESETGEQEEIFTKKQVAEIIEMVAVEFSSGLGGIDEFIKSILKRYHGRK